MTELTYKTAGESHGKSLVILVEGIPLGLEWDEAFINERLARRQRGPGRSKRQAIEKDIVECVAGLKANKTIGAPLAFLLKNKDATIETLPNPTVPRPGHADLAGVYKYASTDIRAVLERASARETASRTVAGAVAALFLKQFGIEVFGYVTEIGGVAASGDPYPSDRYTSRAASEFYSLDSKADGAWNAIIDRASQDGETVGGVVEIVAFNVPPGIGHYNSRDERLDGRLAAALMSLPAVKGVEIGLGFAASKRRGSDVHDAIASSPDAIWGGLTRPTNHAGGIEGGMSNGQPIVARIAMKPLPTLRRGMPSVDLLTGDAAPSTYQRSDVCAVPALSVIAEGAVAFEVARAFISKFGGDSMAQVERAFESWKESVRRLF